MLIDTVINFCDETYCAYGERCGCAEGNCNHPSGKCSGSCYNCLYQIHFPDRALPYAKKEYDCVKMLFHYVCQYSYLYATEILCALEHEWTFLNDLPYYNIFSLGCGGCADLMAFDYLRQLKNTVMPISYLGIDINKNWIPIHQKIQKYCYENSIRFKICYDDVFNVLNKYSIIDVNIVIISYLISYLYNTNQINEINILARRLSQCVIQNKKTPLLLIINDVNSNKRGRDYFCYFEMAVKECGLKIKKREYKYFDTGNLFAGQKIGSPYNVNHVTFEVPRKIKNIYHPSTSINKTVQLLLEVS